MPTKLSPGLAEWPGRHVGSGQRSSEIDPPARGSVE